MLTLPRLTAVLALLLVLVVGLTLLISTTLQPMYSNRVDFYPHWVGGRAFWNGESPYLPEITERIHLGMWGETLPPEGIDQFRVVYPAYTSILLAPLLPLDSATSISVWMTIQLLAVIATPILWLAITRHKPSPIMLGALLLGLAFLFKYPFFNLITVAQFTGTMTLLTSIAALLLILRRDIAAGIVLAFVTIPPTVGAGLALMILGGHALAGRWRGLIAFVVTLGVLTLFTLLRIGWWIPGMLTNLRDYTQYAFTIWPPGLIPFLPLTVAIIAAMVGLVVLVVLRLRQQITPERQIDLVITALIAAVTLLPMTGSYYLVLLIPALAVTIIRASERPPAVRYALWIGCALAILSPWLYFSLESSFPSLEKLMVPLHVALLWTAVNAPVWFGARERAAAAS